MPHEVVTFMIPIFQMRKSRHRRSHSFRKWGRWDLNPDKSDRLTEEPELLSTM